MKSKFLKNTYEDVQKWTSSYLFLRILAKNMTWQLWSTSGSSFWPFFITISCLSLFYLINLVTRLLEINIYFSHIISSRSSHFTITLYDYTFHFTLSFTLYILRLHFTITLYILRLHFTITLSILRLHFTLYNANPNYKSQIEFADNKKTY